jgi:hypothetical protein
MKDYNVYFIERGGAARNILFCVSVTWMELGQFGVMRPVVLQYSGGRLIAIFKPKYKR